MADATELAAVAGNLERLSLTGRQHGLMDLGPRPPDRLRHPLSLRDFNRGPFLRPGDAFTVNAASGSGDTSSGPSYRQIFDLANWDRGVATNLPGESGDPASPHYSDLAGDWAAGKYHPLPFSRRAVELVTEERIALLPLR